MNKLIIISLSLALYLIMTGCSVFEGPPEEDNPDNVRGSYVWMTQRLNEEEDDSQLSSQFGNESNSDLNDERPDAMNLDDSSFPGMDKN